MDVMSRRRILLGQPHGVTVSGAVVTFDTDMSAPIKTSAIGDVHIAHRNLIPSDVEYYDGHFINSSGVVGDDASYRCNLEYIPVVPGETFAFQFYKLVYDTLAFTVPLYTADKTFIQRVSVIPGMSTKGAGRYTGTLVIPSNAQYLRYSIPLQSQDVQIEIASTSTDFDNSAITYTSGESIKSLKGRNCIWAESGVASFTYWTH